MSERNGYDESLWNSALGPSVPQLAGVKDDIDPRKLLRDAAVREKLGIDRNEDSIAVHLRSAYHHWTAEEDAVVAAACRSGDRGWGRKAADRLGLTRQQVYNRRNQLRKWGRLGEEAA